MYSILDGNELKTAINVVLKSENLELTFLVSRPWVSECPIAEKSRILIGDVRKARELFTLVTETKSLDISEYESEPVYM